MATNNPTWFDKDFVEKILQDSEKDKSIEVSEITVKPATSKGDNYTSDMFRVTVEFSRVQDGNVMQEEKSLILKVAPQDVVRGQMIEDGGFFVTELSILSVTLPRMNEILRNVCSTLLGPRYLYVQYEKPTHTVIEDLAPKGFRMADRHAGMDLDHCLLAVRNLGRFHAASLAVKEKDPKALAQYNKWVFHKDLPPSMHQFFKSSMTALTDETVKWPGFDPRITEKLLNLSEVLFKKVCEATQYRKDDFNVLNHGDYWINNMMFRYDEQQKPIDHIFVDFQICFYGSPAVDLLYFLGTSPNDEVQVRHRELLLHEYYESLKTTMTKMKCETEVISFDNLQEILKERAYCELVAAIIILPIVALGKDEKIDIEDMIEKVEEYKNPGYRSNAYKKIMSRLLPLYDSMGLLDV